MIRKWKLLLVGVSCVMGTAMAQNNPILLFPKGAPGETTKLIEKADADGGKTGGETVLRITNVSEPTIGRNEPGSSADRSNGILCRRASFGDGKQQFR